MLKKIKDIEIQKFSGKVVDVQKNSETHVHGEGGGGYWVSVKVGSTISRHLQIFLMDDEGNESNIQVTNWDFPVRTGQELDGIAVQNSSLINESPMIAVLHNKNLNQITWGYDDLRAFCKRSFWWYRAYALFSLIGLYLLGSFVFLIFDWGGSKWWGNFTIYGALLSWIIYMVGWRKLYSDLKAKLKMEM